MAKLTDVIQYEGDNSTFVWKHPCEDFNSLTQLVVHESQEAVFFMNGQALSSYRSHLSFGHTYRMQKKILDTFVLIKGEEN